MTDQTPSITCPVCGMRSYHPTDVETGYCGNCHGYTSPVNPLETARRVVRDVDRHAGCDHEGGICLDPLAPR